MIKQVVLSEEEYDALLKNNITINNELFHAKCENRRILSCIYDVKKQLNSMCKYSAITRSDIIFGLNTIQAIEDLIRTC